MKRSDITERFIFRVTKTADGEAFIGRCDALPHLSHRAVAPAGALRGIMERVDAIYDESAQGRVQAIAA